MHPMMILAMAGLLSQGEPPPPDRRRPDPTPPPPAPPSTMTAIVGTEGSQVSGEAPGTLWSREAIASCAGTTVPVQGPNGSTALVALVDVVELDDGRLQARATISPARMPAPRGRARIAGSSIVGKVEAPRADARNEDVRADVDRIARAERRRRARAEKRLRALR